MQTEIINQSGQIAHQSRLGYHSCDYKIFLKLKALNKVYTKSQHQAKAWFRWARKAEHNRKGTEPQVSVPFCSIVPIEQAKAMASWTMYSAHARCIQDQEGCTSGYVYDAGYWDGNSDRSVVVRHFDIPENYRRARTPQATPDDVLLLTIPTGQIDAMMREAGLDPENM